MKCVAKVRHRDRKGKPCRLEAVEGSDKCLRHGGAQSSTLYRVAWTRLDEAVLEYGRELQKGSPDGGGSPKDGGGGGG
jgi:hypothetical protein